MTLVCQLPRLGTSLPKTPRALLPMLLAVLLSITALLPTSASASSGCYGGTPPTVPPGNPNNLPNIVFIMLDDGGYADFGAYGCELTPGACEVQLDCPADPAESSADHWLKTPNIDAIADNGIRFTQHYMTPTCSPTRISLLSGGYQQRLNVRRQLPLAQTLQLRGTAAEVLPLPDMLRQQGYRTGHFGKWHAGFGKEEFRPLSVGFDEACTLLESDADAPGATGHGYCDPSVRDGNQTSHQVVSGYTTEVLFDYAEDFVERHAAAGAPFFLQIWPWAPHSAWEFGSCAQPCPAACDDPCSTDPLCAERNIQCFLDDYQGVIGGQSRLFGSVVAKLDEQVGLLRAKLAALGIADDTLFIVTNDNGGIQFGLHASNGELFDFKGSVHEGGVRTAFVAEWNDGIPQAERGTDHAGPVMRFELYPTLAELAGADLGSLDFDGRSYASVFSDSSTVRQSETLFWEHQPSRERFEDAVTTDDFRYNDFAVRQDRWKLVYHHDHANALTPSLALYDFVSPQADASHDPSEGPGFDVAASHPDVVLALTENYFDWRRETTLLPFEVNHDLDEIERVGRDLRVFGNGGFARLFDRTRLDFADGSFAFTTRLRPDAGTLGATDPRWIAGKPDSWELLLQPNGTVTLRVLGTGIDLQAVPEVYELTSTAAVSEAAWNTVAFDIHGWRNDTSELRLHVNGQTVDDWIVSTTNEASHGIRYVSTNSNRVWVGGGWLASDRLPFLGTLRDVEMRVSSLYPEEVRRFHEGELFFDDFELGTYDFDNGQLGDWDLRVDEGAELSVSAAAALFGSRGFAVEVDQPAGSAGDRGFLVTLEPDAEQRLRASVRVDLRQAAIDDGDTQRILVARTADDATHPGYANTLMLVVRRSGAQHQAQAWARLDGGSWVITEWAAVEEGGVDGLATLELEWRSASSSTLDDGFVILRVEGGDTVEERGLDNGDQGVGRVDLGVIDSVTYANPSTVGIFVFDLFELYRY